MMTRCIWILLVLFTPALPLANELPLDKVSEEFIVGVTGIHAKLVDGELQVTKVVPNTPAQGQLQAGDVLLAVDGTSLEKIDPRQPLGLAINAAEGRNGKMKFSVRRGGSQQDLIIQLEPIGSYSSTYPLNCKKSQRIARDAAAFIVAQGGPGGGITGNLEGLFLLSTGDKQYLPVLEKYALKLAKERAGDSVWYIGYSGIFLGEYYLATGDRRVLPALKARCDSLSAGQYYGGWGHGTGICVPGYVTGGLVNAAGDQAVTTLVLARECGVAYDQKAYDQAIAQFFRFAGRGGVPYGDHLPELWASTNGKNGGLASAFALLPDKKFQAAAKMLALAETDSYYDTETGHGSIFGNQTWRNIVDVLVMDVQPESYRRHKDEMIWYFELSRMPGGGFRTPWYPGHGTLGESPTYQTGLLAMAYTAHLKNLRICGKPRTKFSVKHQPTEVEKSLAADDFLRTDFIDGVKIDEAPHEIYAAFSAGKPGDNTPKNKQMPVEWYARIMRHYSPTFRAWAAHGLGFQGAAAIPEINRALASRDGRLRVAGLDAISCTTGWSVGKTKSNITPAMIEKQFLPQILRTLRDSRPSMWEKRYALMALSCCNANTIAAHLDVVTPFLKEDEWWLRTAAFANFEPLINDTASFRRALPVMLASYDGDSNLASRRWGSTSVFKRAIERNPVLKEEIVKAMATSAINTEIREGLKQIIDVNNVYETLRYVNLQKEPQNMLLMLPAIERVYPQLADDFSRWTIVGERWGNIGLVPAAERLGKDAGPIIATLKRIQPNLEARNIRKKDTKAHHEALDALKTAVQTYEEKYGVVSLD